MPHPLPDPQRDASPALRPRWGTQPAIAFDIIRRERIGSTNDELRALALKGAAHGAVVHAAQQTAGRGRSGRWWLSPPGNLHASILLRTGIPVRRSAELGFVAALAVADTVDAALPPGMRAALKWPNDVLLAGAKVAGILLERLEMEGGQASVIVGVGLNVAHAPGGLPYPATCLQHHGTGPLSAAAILDGLLAAFARRWAEWLRDGFPPVRAAWLRRGPALGAMLQVSSPGGQAAGEFQGLDTDGALVLRTADGTRRFVAGDVAALPA